MSEKKHSGENIASITTQIQFVPLKIHKDDKEKITTISIRVNNNEKGILDNIRELKLLVISKLELLINMIFYLKR